VQFVLRSNPRDLPGGSSATLQFNAFADLLLTSADPQYDTVTSRSTNHTSLANPLAGIGSTRVQIREVVQPANRPIETLIVEAPRLLRAQVLEVVEAAILSFDRATDMGGRDVASGIPTDLQGSAAASGLVGSVRAGGFRCSRAAAGGVPVIAAETLFRVFGDTGSGAGTNPSSTTMCAWQSSNVLVIVPASGVTLQAGNAASLGAGAIRAADVILTNPAT